MADVEVIILDQTGAVTQKGFGLILVFDPTQDIPYTEISETSEIPSPLDSTDVAYKMIERILGQTIHPDIVAVYGYDMDQVGGVKTIATIMNELAIEHNEFYWPLLADRTDANIQAMAAWAAANGKFFIAGNNKGNTAAQNVALAAAIASKKCAIYAHDGGVADADPYLDAGIAGYMAPLDPGSATFKFKTIGGIPVATYSKADTSTMLSGNVNTYIKDMGDLITNEGLTTGGTFIDTEIAKDWLAARIKENLTQLLHSIKKIPQTAAGIAMVGARLKENLEYAVSKGVISQDEQGNGEYTISLPSRATIPTNDRANRILPDINWECYIAGAVHKIKVTGTLLI